MDDADKGTSLLATLAKLWVRGVNIDLAKTSFDGEVGSIPPGLMPRESYWCVKGEAQMRLKLEAGKGTTVLSPEAEVAAPSPVVVESSDDATLDNVLDVVSKVSAYPKAALQTNMSLTEDLGFDSLMVGDLATGIADAFPGLGGIPQELFINNPSVQDLVDYVKTGGSANLASEEMDDEPLLAYGLRWSKGDFPSWDLDTPLQQCRGKRVLVAGQDDLSAAIRATLAANGAEVVDTNEGPVDAIVWVSNATTPTQSDATPTLHEDSGQFIQLLAAQVANQPRVLAVRREDNYGAAGAGAAARCLAREWDSSIGKEILIETSLTAAAAAPRIIAEIYSNDESSCVRHGQEGRFVRKSFHPGQPGTFSSDRARHRAHHRRHKRHRLASRATHGALWSRTTARWPQPAKRRDGLMDIGTSTRSLCSGGCDRCSCPQHRYSIELIDRRDHQCPHS